jgi:AAA domain
MSIPDARARARKTLDGLGALEAPMTRSAPVNGASASIFIPDEEHERRVQAAVDRERAKREARRRLDAEERGPIGPPTIDSLRDRLARPTRATAFRIAGWQPMGGRVVFAAPFKAGKTTVVANVVRSLADGDAFLGQHAAMPVDGMIALLDFEMGGAQLDAWLRAQRIRHDDRVLVLPMRGQVASFNILDSDVRATWAALLQRHRVAYIVVDCLRPILDGLGLDEHRDPGRFLVALDALLLEAGISECLVVHHMGHLSERSRGDSRLRDWPDVEWRLVRQNDDPASARYITAYGRDVDVPESRLVYDPVTRALTIAAGSRRDATTRDALTAVLAALEVATEPVTGRAIKRLLAAGDHGRDAIDSALRLGCRTGAIAVQDGPKHSKLYRLPGSVPVSGSVREVSEDGERECPSPYRDGTLARAFPSDEVLSGHSDTPSSQLTPKARSRHECKEPTA